MRGSSLQVIIPCLYSTVTGSVAGIVKIWDLSSLLRPSISVSPLRKINMKGILHYPIKVIRHVNGLNKYSH